jgi:hypothetical protein
MPQRKSFWPLLITLLVPLLVAVLATTALARPTAQPQIQRDIERVEQRTSDLRELKPLAPVAQLLISRDEARSILERKILEENEASEIEANQLRWEALGFVEPGRDIVGIFLDVIGEQVQGFYDPEARTLYVVVEGNDSVASLRPTDVVTLAHEITHALQDQHYDLRASQDALRTENDRLLAYQALVEGDATLLSALYARSHLSPSEMRAILADASSGSTAALDAAPLIIQRELLFPYTEGAVFVAEQYQRGGWSAVDEVWKAPPASTEQVLHPEKYLAREEPIVVTLPDLDSLLGPEWQRLEESTLGELDWRVLFEQYVDSSTATRVAAGWGGDRFQLFKRNTDGATALAVQTVWDTPNDAQEFFDAYAQVASRRYGGDIDSSGPMDMAGRQVWSGRAGAWSHEIAATGDRVSLTISTDPGATAALAGAVAP